MKTKEIERKKKTKKKDGEYMKENSKKKEGKRRMIDEKEKERN